MRVFQTLKTRRRQLHNEVHVMVDIETLGTGSNAAIVSIGACEFTLEKGPDESRTFYRRINLRSCIEAGMDVDADTVLWWLEQSPEALQELTSKDDRVNVSAALMAFNEWLPSKAMVYSNGPSFDAKTLSTAMKNLGMKPIPHWHERDHRTALDFLAYRIGASPKDARGLLKEQFHAVSHIAVDDAILQAKHQAILWKLERTNRAKYGTVEAAEGEVERLNADILRLLRAMVPLQCERCSWGDRATLRSGEWVHEWNNKRDGFGGCPCDAAGTINQIMRQTKESVADVGPIYAESLHPEA